MTDNSVMLTPKGHLPTGNWPKDELVRYVPAEPLEAEIERLRYVLAGVRGAIKTGRNEPLAIWKDQIDIALGERGND